MSEEYKMVKGINRKITYVFRLQKLKEYPGLIDILDVRIGTEKELRTFLREYKKDRYRIQGEQEQGIKISRICFSQDDAAEYLQQEFNVLKANVENAPITGIHAEVEKVKTRKRIRKYENLSGVKLRVLCKEAVKELREREEQEELERIELEKERRDPRYKKRKEVMARKKRYEEKLHQERE